MSRHYFTSHNITQHHHKSHNLKYPNINTCDCSLKVSMPWCTFHRRPTTKSKGTHVSRNPHHAMSCYVLLCTCLSTCDSDKPGPMRWFVPSILFSSSHVLHALYLALCLHGRTNMHVDASTRYTVLYPDRSANYSTIFSQIHYNYSTSPCLAS